MRKTSTLFKILCLILSLTIANAQSNFPGTEYTAFGSMDIQDQTIAIGGNCDQFWYSKDNGSNWSYATIPNTIRNLIIRPDDPSQIYISVFGGMMLIDEKGDVIQNFESDSLVQNLGNFINMVHDEDHIYLLGQGGIIKGDWATHSWKQIWQDTSENDYPYSVAIAGDELILGMRRGRLIKVNKNTGAHSIKHDFEDWVFNISMGTNQVGYINLQSKGIRKTTDQWETVEEVTGLPENINPIAYGENIVITVNTNRIYVSKDGGKTSERITTNNTADQSWTRNAYMSDNGEFYMIGESAMILKSTDFGTTFESLNMNYRGIFYGLDFNSSGVGLAVGEYGAICRSSDWGETWTMVDILNSENYFNHVSAMNDGNFFICSEKESHIVGNDGKVVQTIGRGFSDADYNPEENYLIGIEVVSSGMSKIHKSTDGGVNWTSVYEGDQAGYDIEIGKDGHIWLPTENGNVYHSADNGTTWSTKKYGDNYISKITSGHGAILYTSGRDAMLSTNGGNNFDKIGGGYATRNAHIVAPDHYIFTTDQNSATTLYEVINGENARVKYSNCARTFSLYTTDKNEAITAHEGGHINKFDLTGAPSNTDDYEDIPYVVYPNPLQAGMNIKWDSTVDKATLFDISGRKMITAYSQVTELSTMGLMPGVYILSLDKNDSTQNHKVLISH